MQPKARRLLGVLYSREYYQCTEPQTLLQLYISLVCPHLEDASLSMESQLAGKKKHTIKDVQKFALRMCSKCWDQTYSQLLQQFNIPTSVMQIAD